MTSFIAQLTDLRRKLPALRHADWFTGLPTAHATDAAQPDIAWMDANGQALSADAWNHPHDRTLMAAITVGEPGQPVTERVLVVWHASHHTVDCALPPGTWVQRLNSAHPASPSMPLTASLPLNEPCVCVLVQPVSASVPTDAPHPT